MCQSASQSEIVSELRLARTILERLECSFARQEAKFDQLLNMMREKQTVETAPTSQHSQRHQQPAVTPLQQFSTPVTASGPSQSMPCGPPSHSMEFTTPIHYQRATLSDLDRLLDDSDLAGNNISRNYFILLVFYDTLQKRCHSELFWQDFLAFVYLFSRFVNSQP